MAAVTKVRPKFVSPNGYEVVDKGTLTEAVTAGDLLVYGVAGISKAAPGAVEAHGIATQDGYAGQGGFDVLIQGEMDGFSGLTPGAPLYPSATVAGGLDTTAPASAVARVRAVTATRIRVNFT